MFGKAVTDWWPQTALIFPSALIELNYSISDIVIIALLDWYQNCEFNLSLGMTVKAIYFVCPTNELLLHSTVFLLFKVCIRLYYVALCS